MTHVELAFEITSWDAAPEPEGADGRPEAARAMLTKAYSGELEGTATVDFLGTQNDVAQAYVAQEVVLGRLAGRSGGFVLQHGAAGGAGLDARQWAFVVPGSGTGELAGLRGEGKVEHGLLVLDYELD